MPLLEVFADVACPFAHASFRALRARRQAAGREDVILHVRAWPLELVNGRPLDPKATAEHVADLKDQIDNKMFSGFDAAHQPATSLPALALAAAAYRADARTGEAMSFALRDALFERGLDIADPTVLDDLAGPHGVPSVTESDRARVHADWEEGQRRGVKGSPHFFCEDEDAFCPSLDIEKRADGHLHLERNMAALDEFLSRCWG